MIIVTAESKKPTGIKISKSEWLEMGKRAGWLKEARTVTQIQVFITECLPNIEKEFKTLFNSDPSQKYEIAAILQLISGLKKFNLADIVSNPATTLRVAKTIITLYDKIKNFPIPSVEICHARIGEIRAYIEKAQKNVFPKMPVKESPTPSMTNNGRNTPSGFRETPTGRLVLEHQN